MIRRLKLIYQIAFVLLGALVSPLFGLMVEKPRCEYLTNPLGIHETEPRLSWIVEAIERDQRQTAFRILVASDTALLDLDQGDLWDSGKVARPETIRTYSGAPLSSRSRCFWKVRSWDQDDEPSAWSEPASWTMGLLDASDWSAEWIDAARPAIAPGEVPEILEAYFEAIDGAGSHDATAQLTALAANGGFTLPVNSGSFGGDPAWGHLKQLRVVYQLDGTVMTAIVREGGTFIYPDDLPPPVEISILQANYEAVDGAGSSDVTALLSGLAEGPFSLVVGNTNLGGDPAPNHFKRLRVLYELDGESREIVILENETLRFPHDFIHPDSVPYLRRAFVISKPVRRAMLYATALGLYECGLNGQRVGDHMLAPDWTDYNKRLRYQAYDVTPMLVEGPNAIGAQVAPGWYSGRIGNGGFQRWGTTPALLAQLEIEYADGSSERIVTDSSWKLHPSGLVSSDIMLGERHDARRDLDGWNEASLDDSGWAPAVVRSEPEREICGQVMEPVRELETIAAISVTEPGPGRWTFDLGQNMVGVIRLNASAPAGTQLTIRHAEMLNPDGTIYTANLRGAASIDHYVCRGGGVETWQPKFTFHGFRYVEVSGLSGTPPPDTVTGVVLGSDTPAAGEFSCSDPRINQLQSNIVWGQRGNYLSVPTDCPQRDERLGWMGDAQVFVRTATFNSDVAAFFTKWMDDVNDAQQGDGAFTDVVPFVGFSAGTPGWGDAGVICPWMIYQAYGDVRILERCYPAMRAWVEWCRNHSSNSIRSSSRGFDYGDWLSINANTDKELIGTAYYARSAQLLAQAAAVLGNSTDAAAYEALFQTIRQAFIDRYVSPDGRVTSDTQSAYVLALEFDLVPDAWRAAVASRLEADIVAKGDHLSTGFLGAGQLLPALTSAGKPDVAYRLLQQDTFPSWLFPVSLGATTIWERWDGWTPANGFQDAGMNSFNHYSLGACGEWLFSTVGGIDSAAPGFGSIVIRPIPGGTITSASARLDSIRGRISSRWSSSAEGFAMSVEIPANTTAEVHVPAGQASDVSESGMIASLAEGVEFLRMSGGAAVFRVGSGRYRFTTGSAAPGTDPLAYDPGTPRRIRIADLATDPFTFVSVDSISTRGAVIEIDGEWLVYQAGDQTAANDGFNYTVRGADGGMFNRSVLLSPIPADAPVQRATKIERLPDGSSRVSFSGVPGRTYRIEYTDDFKQWTEIAARQAGADGGFEVIDPAPLPDARFYRAVFP